MSIADSADDVPMKVVESIEARHRSMLYKAFWEMAGISEWSNAYAEAERDGELLIAAGPPQPFHGLEGLQLAVDLVIDVTYLAAEIAERHRRGVPDTFATETLRSLAKRLHDFPGAKRREIEHTVEKAAKQYHAGLQDAAIALVLNCHPSLLSIERPLASLERATVVEALAKLAPGRPKRGKTSYTIASAAGDLIAAAGYLDTTGSMDPRKRSIAARDASRKAKKKRPKHPSKKDDRKSARKVPILRSAK